MARNCQSREEQVRKLGLSQNVQHITIEIEFADEECLLMGSGQM